MIMADTDTDIKPKVAETTAPSENKSLDDKTVSDLIKQAEEDLNKERETLSKDIEARILEKLNIPKPKDDKDTTQVDAKDKEISELKKKLSDVETNTKKITEEIVEKYTKQMKEQYDKLNTEIAKRQSVVEQAKNPFSKVKTENDKLPVDWWNSDKLSKEEVKQIFAEHVLGKKSL